MNKSKENIIRHFQEQKANYEKQKHFQYEVFDMTHAGKVFYLSYNDDLFGPMKKKFHGGFPFYLSFIKDGTVNWLAAFSDGFIKKEFAIIKNHGISYVKKSRLESLNLKNKIDKFLERNRLLPNQSLEYYCQKIQASYYLLLEMLSAHEAPIFIDPYLDKELEIVFSGWNEIEYKEMAVCPGASQVEIHERKLLFLLSWCRENKITLTNSNWQSNYAHLIFKEKLNDCYSHGYFLYSGIGGVRFWSIEDEYNLLVETSRKINQARNNLVNDEKQKLNLEQKLWLTIARHFSFLRDDRKTMQQKIFYFQAECLEAISEKLLIDRRLLEHLKPGQFRPTLLRDKSRVEFLFEKQKQASLFVSLKEKGHFFEFGREAEKIYEDLRQRRQLGGAIVKGSPVYGGFARGRARIIFNTNEKYIFNPGDILVTGMTYPDFLPLMKKAGAIVTDVGGITCHAAIIARELNKPCVIGTKNATKIIKDGSEVEVNADIGEIKII